MDVGRAAGRLRGAAQPRRRGERLQDLLHLRFLARDRFHRPAQPRSGWSVFGPRFVPLLTAALPNNRFQAFGNLFVVHGDGIHRLDRHPVMSRHPSTPMDEGDLGRHLARQTDLPVGLVDLAAMKAGRGSEVLARARGRGRADRLDGCDRLRDARRGRTTNLGRGARKAALRGRQPGTGAWPALRTGSGPGLLDAAPKPPPPARVERIAAVSGSVAVTTAEQIAHAAESGFEVIQVDATQALDERAWAGEAERAVGKALRALGSRCQPADLHRAGAPRTRPSRRSGARSR